MPTVVAVTDPNLAAHVITSVPLYYSAGADVSLDRPSHIRAGSGLARVGERLAVVQDDANFVAMIDQRTGRVDAIMLPAGNDSRRQFDESRGTKAFKLDLEACMTIPTEDGELLVAFGSGSSPRREYIVTIAGLSTPAPAVELHDASTLYSTLRAATDFAGSDLNIEGIVFVDGSVRLFGRGNGAPRDDLFPRDATCDISWPSLAAYLDRSQDTPPTPCNIRQYDLGTLGGLRLTFTDATSGFATVVFSAAAEASPDATRDGPVAGSAIGVFDNLTTIRWAALRGMDGASFDGKVEGIVLHPTDPTTAYVVVDRDDPARPAELCTVRLTGPWFRA